MATEEENENLLAQVRDYYRRKNRRNTTAALAGFGGVLQGMAGKEDPLSFVERVMKPGYGPAQLSPEDRVKAKQGILELQNDAIQARQRARAGDIEALAAAGEADDKFVQAVVTLTGDEMAAQQAVSSSYNRAIQAGFSDVQDTIQQAVESAIAKNPTSSPGIMNLRTQARDVLKNAFAGGRGGELSGEDVALLKNYLGQLGDPMQKAAAVADLRLAADTLRPGDKAPLGIGPLIEQISAQDGGFGEEFKQMVEGEVGKNADILIRGAVANSAKAMEILQEELHQGIRGAATRFPQIAEAMKAYWNDGLSPEEKQQALAGYMEDMGSPDGTDPDADRRFTEALDQLDPESETYNPTLQMVRDDLFKQPAFQEYMNKTGITDPMVALRQLKKEAKRRARAGRQASQQAADERNKQIAAGQDAFVDGKAAVGGQGAGQARDGNIEGGLMGKANDRRPTPRTAKQLGSAYLGSTPASRLRTLDPGRSRAVQAGAQALRNMFKWREEDEKRRKEGQVPDELPKG